MYILVTFNRSEKTEFFFSLKFKKFFIPDAQYTHTLRSQENHNCIDSYWNDEIIDNHHLTFNWKLVYGIQILVVVWYFFFWCCLQIFFIRMNQCCCCCCCWNGIFVFITKKNFFFHSNESFCCCLMMMMIALTGKQKKIISCLIQFTL